MRIAIFGTVGAGKTTLINHLKKLLPGYEVFSEPLQHNPYFGNLYTAKKDIQNLTYKMEIFMLAARMHQLKESRNLRNVIFDRGVMDTIVFADTNHQLGKIDDRDWGVYESYFEVCMMPSLFAEKRKAYDLIIYLKVDDQTSVDRIHKRAIPDEQKVDESFWRLLNQNYNKWYEAFKDKAPWFVIDGNTEDQDDLARQIKDYIVNINN